MEKFPVPCIKFSMGGVARFNSAGFSYEVMIGCNVPNDAIAQAAMMGHDLRGYTIMDFVVDMPGDAVHLTLLPPVRIFDGVVSLPVIPFTEDNYDPLHGPNSMWWYAMEQSNQDKPCVLHASIVEEVRRTIFVDLHGIPVRSVRQSADGYIIKVNFADGVQPINLTRESAEQVAELIENPPPFNARMEKALADAKSGTHKVERQSTGLGKSVGDAIDAVLDAVTLGSLLD